MMYTMFQGMKVNSIRVKIILKILDHYNQGISASFLRYETQCFREWLCHFDCKGSKVNINLAM